MKYNQKDKVIINNINITGVKSPMISLSGNFSKSGLSLLFVFDGKQIKPDYEFINKSYGFDYHTKFDHKTKKIKIYLQDKNNKYLIKDIKTNFLKRSFKRVNEIIANKGKSLFISDTKTSNCYYNPSNKTQYNKWLKGQPKEKYNCDFKYNPLISIITPVYNVKPIFLKECIESVENQVYQNWELCLIDDCSTNDETKKALKSFENTDKRIRIFYRNKNGNISLASNDGINNANGEFIALLDNDDTITRDALYQMVKVLNENENIDFIYSDEDKWDERKIPCDPYFKPDFSPDTLLSENYICHFTMIRKALIKEIGGFEVGLEGAQDYDLFLKATEKARKIYHIAKVLYHWRISETSTAANISTKGYAIDRGKLSVEHALKRRNINANVIYDETSGHYIVKYLLKKEPLVSIIIPTKDYADTLDVCLKSIYSKTKYKNYEVIVVNNNSKDKNTFKLFKKYQKKYSNFNVINANIPFNYSKINNIAAKKAKGEYLLFLNNDTEVITKDYMTYMVGYAMQNHIGAVGAKLLFFDNTLQHGGIILGINGVAGHAYYGCSRNEVGLAGKLRVPFDYGAVTAACLMVSKRKFNEVGGFEEKLKINFNDIDFNIKLLEKGYYNVLLPQVEFYHYESKSRGLDNTPEKHDNFMKECCFIINKWKKYIDRDPFYNKNLSLTRPYYLEKTKQKNSL